MIGLSILSGSHRELIPAVIAALDGADIPVVVGGIIPDADVPELRAAGVAAVYTPKDFELDRIMHDIVALVAERNDVRSRVGERRARGVARGGRPATRARARRAGAEPARDADRARGGRRARLAPPATAPATCVGVTGPPGVGKSTLLSALLREWRSRGRSVAVLAVDPSSKRSGGALLGDRARIEHDPADRDVFIRSMAAGERLGGLAPATRAAAQALAAAFDVVVIETVGVGQSETDVAEAADTVAVDRPARLRRRAAVPEGRDHGGARRARGHQGRPRRAGPPRRGGPARRARRARRRTRPCWPSPRCGRPPGIDALADALAGPPRRPRPRRHPHPRAPARRARRLPARARRARPARARRPPRRAPLARAAGARARRARAPAPARGAS